MNPRVETLMDKYKKAYEIVKKIRAYQRAYRQKPEVKAYQRAYRQKPKAKAYQHAYYKEHTIPKRRAAREAKIAIRQGTPKQ